ncbi:MAG: hypothetical protein HC892_02380 [Saprospiraceae bacterium]|nr:hypothetical protein [Saprospiraceae bacterium]
MERLVFNYTGGIETWGLQKTKNRLPMFLHIGATYPARFLTRQPPHALGNAKNTCGWS